MTVAFAGQLEITLAMLNHRVIAEDLMYRGNTRLSARIPVDLSGVPCYFIINIGGGYLEGECYRNSIRLKDDARAAIMTQTPTYVYKCGNRAETVNATELFLGEGSCLEFLLDEVICYRSAIFRQETTIEMKKGATLIYSDGFSSGWSPDGKPFQYSRLRVKTRVFIEGRLAYMDHMLLVPELYPMEHLGMLEGYGSYGSVLIIDSRIDQEFLQQLRKQCDVLPEGTRWGASMLEDHAGIIVRFLAQSSQRIRQVASHCIDYARHKLLGSEPLRTRKNEE